MLVKNENGQIVTNSLLVAKKFGKQHKHVLSSIRDLIHSAENSAQYYVSSSYIDNSGKANKMYVMGRDGFSLLVMGFTGSQAINFKLEFIEAFNQMEEKLTKSMSTLDMVQASIDAIRANEQKLNKVEEDILELKAKVITTPDYFTVAGFGTVAGQRVGRKLASEIGRKATKICKNKSYPMEKVKDVRWGYVKSYPAEVLEEVFGEIFGEIAIC